MTPTKSGQLLLAIGLALSLGAAVRERFSVRATILEMDELREEMAGLRHHKSALLREVNPTVWGVPFLEGDSVLGNHELHWPISDPTEGVFYLLSSNCPACVFNYPFLGELAGRGVPVFGLAIDTDYGGLLNHVRQEVLGFPVLFRPSGSVAEAIPRFATPTTAVVSKGKLIILEFGELREEQRESIIQLTESWRGRRDRS
jgi:hypothetical protein